ERGEVGAEPLPERLDEDGHHGQTDEQDQKGEGDADQKPPDDARLARGPHVERPDPDDGPLAHGDHASWCRRLHHWSELIPRSRTNEAASITRAIPVAPA